MNGWTITKVWDIDGKLYVAPTIEDAIALYKLFVGDEPRNIKAVGGSSCVIDYAAVIKGGCEE